MRLLRAALAWLRAGYWLVAAPPAPPPTPPVPKERTGDDDVIMRLRLSCDSVADSRRPVPRRWN